MSGLVKNGMAAQVDMDKSMWELYTIEVPGQYCLYKYCLLSDIYEETNPVAE